MNSSDAQDFAQVEHALKTAGALMGAAELHGTLCGMLCVNDSEGGKRIPELLGEGAPAGVAALVTALHDEALRRLRDPEYDFHMLLPDDAEPMTVRTEALGDWCRGFLAGLGLAGLKQGQSLPEGVEEIVKDFIEISQVNFDLGEGDEEDEAAYAEVVEYVRVGVLLVHQEFHPGEDRPIH